MPLVLGRREGARFQDAYSGRWYWNCHCNGGVFNLGHRHPRVVGAVRDALEEIDIGNHHLMSPWRGALAERLVATTGGRLPGVVLGVSGSEVVDVAVKLARGTTGRETIVSAAGGYHGVTGYAMAAGDPQFREPFGAGAAGFVQVPWNDLSAIDAAIGPGHGGGAARGDSRDARLPAAGPGLPRRGRRARPRTRRAPRHRRGADGPRTDRDRVVARAGGCRA